MTTQTAQKRTGLIVDSFAGGGGASTGIFLALGRHPDVAINHDEEAIAMHSANHPQSKHFCESVWKVNPTDVADIGGVDLLWASPDCKHFSKAKGGKPVEKGVRALAWVTVWWAKLVLPWVIIIENVEEFQTWGPLLEDGTPDPKKKGLTFKQLVGRLKGLGYVVEWRELKACDYGAPTSRKRLFVIARRDGKPVVWPAATHGPKVDEPRVRDLFAPPAKVLLPYRTAAECIDFSIPCPSIFGRKRPLADKTLARIARGIQRFVVDNPRPFIVPITHSGAPRVHDIDEPLRTITTAHRGEFALIAPTLIQTGYGEREGQAPRSLDIRAPLGTVVAGGAKHAVVAAFLAKHYGGGYTGPGVPLDGPVSTVTTVDHHALVTAELAPSPPKRPTRGTSDDIAAVGEGAFDPEEYADNDDVDHFPPHPEHLLDSDDDDDDTRAAKRDLRFFNRVAQYDERVIEEEGEDDTPTPCPTCAASAGFQQGDCICPVFPEAAASSLVVLRNNCDGVDVDGPMPTVTAGGTHIGEVRAFLIRYFGNEKAGQTLDTPMSTVTTRDRFGLVTVDGVDHVIIDIGMRMLTARELATAQGFPVDYDLELDGKLSKTAQIRMIGNSVVPQMAAALVSANLPQHKINEAA